MTPLHVRKYMVGGMLLLVLVGLTVLAGCSMPRVPGIRRTPEATPVLTGGTIVVDHPEVFTMSRLIEQRQRNIELLRSKLDSFEPQGYQALRDVRALQIGSEVAGEDENARNIAALQEEIETLKKQRAEMAAAAAEKKQQAEMAAAAEGGGEAERPESPESAQPAPAMESAPTGASQALPGETVAAAPSPSNFVRTEAELSPIEKIRDEMVYSKMLESKLLSVERDDSVTLMGYVEYALKFDVTVIPGENTQTLGEATLVMSGEQSVSREFFRSWRRSLLNNLESLAYSIQRRWASGDLTTREKIRLQNEASRLRSDIRKTVNADDLKLSDLIRREEKLNQDITDAEKAIAQRGNEIQEFNLQLADTPKRTTTLITRNNLEARKSAAQAKISDLESEIRKYEAELRNNKKDQKQARDRIDRGKRRIDSINRFASDLSSKTARIGDDAQRVLCDIIRERYRTFTGDLVTFLPHSRVTIDGYNAYFLQIDRQPPQKLEDQQFKKFSQKISALNIQPYVTRIDPKQFVQNISDSIAREEQAGKGKSSRAVSIYQGVTRKPLAVGYMRGLNEFGWVLGPRLEVDYAGNVTERHVPVQYAFQVNIMVPAWFESIRLAGKYYWLKEDGSLGRGSDIWNGEIEVKLPGEPGAVTWAMTKDTAPLRPIILPPWEPGSARERFILRQGQKATLMIRGSELWRHPRVFLGAQPATRVDILPDGGGLVISFDSIQHPASAARGGNPVVDLTVITSRGRAVLKNAVEVLPE